MRCSLVTRLDAVAKIRWPRCAAAVAVRVRILNPWPTRWLRVYIDAADSEHPSLTGICEDVLANVVSIVEDHVRSVWSGTPYDRHDRPLISKNSVRLAETTGSRTWFR